MIQDMTVQGMPGTAFESVSSAGIYQEGTYGLWWWNTMKVVCVSRGCGTDYS